MENMSGIIRTGFDAEQKLTLDQESDRGVIAGAGQLCPLSHGHFPAVAIGAADVRAPGTPKTCKNQPLGFQTPQLTTTACE